MHLTLSVYWALSPLCSVGLTQRNQVRRGQGSMIEVHNIYVCEWENVITENFVVDSGERAEMKGVGLDLKGD